jgi:hypothetical protein
MLQFWLAVMFLCLGITIVLMLKTNWFTQTAEKKYLWGWNSLVASACTLVILMYMQKIIMHISIFKDFDTLILGSQYLPYILWLFSLYLLRKAAIAKKNNDFRKTHFSVLYTLDIILLAILIPLINIILSLMYALKYTNNLQMMI